MFIVKLIYEFRELIKLLSTITEITNEIEEKDLKAFEFNWKMKSSDESVIYSANVKNDIAGLIEFDRNVKDFHNFMYLIEVKPVFRGTTVAGELLAFIGKDSLENGFDGFVVFESKSLLYEYYIDKYGAKPVRNRRLYFDTEATKRLIRVYLEVNYTQDDILKPPKIVTESSDVKYSVNSIESEYCPRCAEIIAKGEEHIRQYGHGIIPHQNPNELTGLRYILAIEAKLGRKITDSEWESMSIR